MNQDLQVISCPNQSEKHEEQKISLQGCSCFDLFMGQAAVYLLSKCHHKEKTFSPITGKLLFKFCSYY